MSTKLQEYQFSTWDINEDFRETFFLSFYSIEEAIEYAEEWLKLNPFKSILSILLID